MPLAFQLVQAPFRFGLEEGQDPKQVPFGTLLTAENVVWKKSGRLEKRQGTETITSAISGGGSITSAKRLIVRGGELCLTDGATFYSYTNGSWISRGRHPEVGLEWSTLNDSTMGVKSSDTVYLSNGNVVHAWVTGDPAAATLATGDLYYQVIELATGAVVTPATLVDTGTGWRIRLLVSGSTWVLVYAKASDLKSFVNSTTTTLKTDLDSAAPSGLEGQCLDACIIGTGFVVAYPIAGGGGGIRLVRYSIASTPVQQATGVVTGETSVAIMAISICGAAGETLYIGYADLANSKIKFAAANPSTMVQTVAPTNVEAPTVMHHARVGLVRTSATTCAFLYSFHGDAATFGNLKAASLTNAGAITNGNQSTFLQLLSRPFLLNGRVYAAVATDPSSSIADQIFGADSFLVEATATGSLLPFREVGKIDLDIAGKWAIGYVCDVASVSSTRAVFPVPYQSTAASANVGWRVGTRLVEATIGASVPADMWRSIAIGQETYIAGGVLGAYDGVEVIGYGWAHPPFVDEAGSSMALIGGTMDAGDYIFDVTGERRSAAGVLHRSPTGVPISANISAGNTGLATLSLVPVLLSYSSKSPGLLPIYRSIVGGDTTFRLTIEPTFTTVFNVQTIPLTVSDGTADNAVGGLSGIPLSSLPVIYTEGGELEDQQPPSLVTLALYRERIFGVGGDRRTIWFSKHHGSNPGVAPGFNEQLRLVFNDTLTSLAVLDERLVVFSETGIYYFSGDGPAPDGSGSDYGQANKLQTDVGCTNPRGVVSGAEGVYFVSDDEIHLLGRDLNVTWISKPVQDQLAAFPNVTSAVLVPKKNHVRFSCNNEAGTAGIVLVYDVVERQWSTFIYDGGLVIADACIHDGVYTFVTTAGVIYKESDSTHLDDGSWVTAKIETAWVHAAGPLAYHSVRNFRIDGVSATAHGLAISVGFDGNLTYQQGPEAWAAGVSGVTTPGDSVTANISIGNRRKCRSIRFRVQDSAPAVLGTGQGAKWSSMGIEVGLKRGLGRLPVRQKG